MAKYIPLKQMIEDLGYLNAEDISNWMQEGILKKKEGFDKYLRDTKSSGNTRRVAHKTHISEEARILVDNLCVIYSFEGFFPVKGGRYATTQYRPYQELKSGEFKRHLGVRAEERFKYYQIQRDRNDNAIANFDNLIAALNSQDAIDITKESIRELMSKTSNVSKSVAFNPYELSSWNKLIELRNQAEQNPEDSVAHRIIAESLYNLNMIDDALLELEKTTRINPKDGIAWAIKAKILHEKLTPSRKEHFQALAMTDFSGHISAPITSEERWINERVDETAESVEEIRKEFIEVTFSTLENWPHWEEVPLSWGQKNYHPDTSITNDCSLKIRRDWVFFHLVMNLRPGDLFTITNAKSRLHEIYKTWRSPSCTYAFPSIYFDIFSKERLSENDFRVRLTAYMAFISEGTHKELLDEFIDMFKRYEFSPEESLATLSNSLISKHLWKHLGPTDYSNLYSLLAMYKRQKDEREKLNTFSEKVVYEIQSTFETAIKLYDQHINKELYRFRDTPHTPVTKKQIEVEFSKALIEAGYVIESMNSMIDRKAIYEMSEPQKMPKGYADLMLYLPLIEYNLTADKEAKDIITFFMKSPAYLECCVGSEDDNLLSLFEKYWAHEKVDPNAEKPTDFFEKVQEIVQQRYWDEFEID